MFCLNWTKVVAQPLGDGLHIGQSRWFFDGAHPCFWRLAGALPPLEARGVRSETDAAACNIGRFLICRTKW